MPPGSRISYQRTPTTLRTATEWFTTSDCRPPRLRYAARNIMRSASESSAGAAVSAWGMQAPLRASKQASAKGAASSIAGSTKLCSGSLQSAWKR